MSKFVFIIMFAAVFMIMLTMQIDEELSIQTLFRGKYSLNRAVHAGAQQVDTEKLSQGTRAIDETKAYHTALTYLEANLQLDSHLRPLPDSQLQSPVQVEVFQVFNHQYTYPYHYTNARFGYNVTLYHPGVVMIIRLHYPRAFHTIAPMTWNIKACDELVVQ